MTAKQKSLFLFLMGLAWRCRFTVPLLLSGTVAMLGQSWMFQIRLQTVHRVPENDLAFFDDDEDDNEDDTSWETDSSTTDSWETIVEEVAYG